ncbi:MAG: hypothetical protein WDN75_16310 [Bacteroidota bacterium]
MEKLPWIFIILGVTALLIGYDKQGDQSATESLNNLPQALKTIGTTILGAGIFTAILKSFQFTGIFKKAVAQVIYSSEYLAKQDRNYLEDTWKQVSQALFTSKFPKIKDDIESAVINTYLPRDHNYYYQSFSVTYTDLKLTQEEDGKYFVSYEQHIKAEIVPLEKSGDFVWRTTYEGNDAKRTITFLSITRDGEKPVNIMHEMEAVLKTNCNTFSKTLPCKCRKYYELEKKETRKIPLDGPTNDQVELCLTQVTARLTVYVGQYDENKLKVSFVNKTIEEFRSLTVEKKGIAIAKESQGVVLPTHGFCLVLSKA